MRHFQEYIFFQENACLWVFCNSSQTYVFYYKGSFLLGFIFSFSSKCHWPANVFYAFPHPKLVVFRFLTDISTPEVFMWRVGLLFIRQVPFLF